MSAAYPPTTPRRHRATGVAARRTQLPDASRHHWWLALPIVAPLMTPLFNRVDPRAFGIPFFYWSQLALAALSTLVISTVHLARRRR
ncbi:MAG: hypothetical protein QOI74_1203 [Micromonosporaceae bacterium]|jgi:hypothetical protein|nr:hypothetical protein [Micromonosporaceae bacterium]